MVRMFTNFFFLKICNKISGTKKTGSIETGNFLITMAKFYLNSIFYEFDSNRYNRLTDFSISAGHSGSSGIPGFLFPKN
ncbi:hypothetical protein SAMN05660293_04282 [Dyadobacter psychrophilus]|uniref:Uncharacterized protein n=1 Tax=Dyadobacter psychrophilus TaxID=651661 RepID=A0A1T5GQK5_9BACT|nr:hypothetical protein SAMN05660293_04282 [Dyadobacter psychrophilus]